MALTSPSSSSLKPLPPPSAIHLPESRKYRIKTRLLGKPLHNDQMDHQRLGKPTALAVFASDAISSTAYATQEMTHSLLAVSVVGAAGFAYVLPLTLALVAVLFILIISYRQTIKAYPTAGGAYIVTKDNLGIIPAQVAGSALITDYILTVSVSVSAGVGALYTVFDGLYPYRTLIALFCISLIAYLNLRGVKESGKIFAVPTYAFLGLGLLMIATGLYKYFLGGGLDHVAPAEPHLLEGTKNITIFILLKAFSSGATAMTGVEAISNGVPAFKKPEAKHAIQTLTIMGGCLATLFIGFSWLAGKLHVVPTNEKTSVGQIAEAIFGHGPIFILFQAATMLILVLAANTAFADLPRLANFHADDAFMPKQLTKRGHRLVFSNGILFLTVAASIPVIILQADVTKLIPLYALGVFLSFTLSQLGMSKHHLRLREKGWRFGLLVNGIGAITTAVITIILAKEKFADGAWVIVVLVPLIVIGLFFLNKQYVREDKELKHEVDAAINAPILRRHSVIVLINRLDQSAARAIQYARALNPDELKAVHVAFDEHVAEQLRVEWSNLGLSRLPLELVDCPDRRITRSVLEIVNEIASRGDTEVSVLIPKREYTRFWHRLLHDQTSNNIAKVLADMPHVNVTFVPFHLGQSNIPQPIFVDSATSLS